MGDVDYERPLRIRDVVNAAAPRGETVSPDVPDHLRALGGVGAAGHHLTDHRRRAGPVTDPVVRVMRDHLVAVVGGHGDALFVHRESGAVLIHADAHPAPAVGRDPDVGILTAMILVADLLQGHHAGPGCSGGDDPGSARFGDRGGGECRTDDQDSPHFLFLSGTSPRPGGMVRQLFTHNPHRRTTELPRREAAGGTP